VCEFDSDLDATAGWASINGKPSVRISGRGDLDRSCMWITNLNYFAFRKHRLFNSPNLYDEQFFRLSYSAIVLELGLSAADPAKRASDVCSIYVRIMERLARDGMLSGFSSNPYRITQVVQQSSLLSPVRYPYSGPDAVRNQIAINESYQENQGTAGMTPKGSSPVTFAFPRSPYCRWLLSLPYPDTKRVSDLPPDFRGTIGHESGQPIRGSRKILGRIKALSEKHTAFFNISVLSQDSHYLHFSEFGNAGRKAIHRSWVSLPELIHLAASSKIDILDGVVFAKGKLKILRMSLKNW